MAYTPREWSNGADGGTPITAEALNHIEQGIAAKAERGPKGTAGADGKQGPPGEPGVSVTAASSDGENVVFELSNGETLSVPWPPEGS